MGMRISSGHLGSRRLAAPSKGVRPTSQRVREAIFSTLGDIIQGARVLDLFAGSGALGLEALSRGASEATFVDSSRASIEAIKKNIASLGLAPRTRVIKADAASFVRACLERFDVVFMDPPYHKRLATDLAPHVYRLVEAGGILVIEHERFIEIGMEIWKQKHYGHTTVTYIVKEGAHAQ